MCPSPLHEGAQCRCGQQVARKRVGQQCSGSGTPYDALGIGPPSLGGHGGSLIGWTHLQWTNRPTGAVIPPAIALRGTPSRGLRDQEAVPARRPSLIGTIGLSSEEIAHHLLELT